MLFLCFGCERVGSCEPGLVASCAAGCGLCVRGCVVRGCGCGGGGTRKEGRGHVSIRLGLCLWCGCGGTRKEGARGAGPPLLWVCVGGGVLLSHTLAGAVPSALAVLASGFGKGKSGRVPAAMAAATLAGPDPPAPGGGCGIRVSHSGHGSSCSPSPGACRPHKRKERGVCWVGRPISAGRLHSLAGRPPPVYQPRRLRGAFPHA